MAQGDDLRQSLERLVKLGQTPEVDIRPVLLRVLVDLFVCKEQHAQADLDQFEDMMQHLLDDADADVRLIVAEKLAPHPATPRSLLDRFLGYGGAIAVPVLEHAAVAERPCSGSRTGVLRPPPGPSPDASTSILRLPQLWRTGRSPTSSWPWPGTPLRRSTDRPSSTSCAGRATTRRSRGRCWLARVTRPIARPLFLVASSEQRAAIMLAARREDLGPESKAAASRPGGDGGADPGRTRHPVTRPGRLRHGIGLGLAPAALRRLAAHRRSEGRTARAGLGRHRRFGRTRGARLHPERSGHRPFGDGGPHADHLGGNDAPANRIAADFRHDACGGALAPRYDSEDRAGGAGSSAPRWSLLGEARRQTPTEPGGRKERQAG